MNKLIKLIQQKEELREKFRNILLLSLMKASIAYPRSFVDFFKVANSAGLDKESAKEMFDYFKSEGFFNRITSTGFVDISPKAVREAEKYLTNAQQSTEHKVESKRNNKQSGVHPNTIWIKKHHAEYAGKYVALKDGELIAIGTTIKEADLKAKKKGVDNPMLTYLFPLDREPFGGW